MYHVLFHNYFSIHFCILLNNTRRENIFLHTFNLIGNSHCVDHTMGRRGHDYMVVAFKTTYALSVPITTNVVSSNPTQASCTRYNIV